MMTKLKAEVTKLVDFELEMANKEHGERFNSAHEAYAVMKEEYEEAKDNFRDVDYLLNQLFWDSCKYNESGVSFAESIKSEVIKASCECIQVAAMAQKFINGEKNT